VYLFQYFIVSLGNISVLCNRRKKGHQILIGVRDQDNTYIFMFYHFDTFLNLLLFYEDYNVHTI
jgi:hypothetical protein